MNPPLVSWLLAVPYVLTVIGFLFIAWAAGGSAYALLVRRSPTDTRPWHYRAPGAGMFLLFTRIAAGLAILSWLAAVIGVAGQFSLPLILALLLSAVVVGLFLAGRYAPLHRPAIYRDRLGAGHLWINATRGEKIFTGVVLLAFCAVVVNAIIGALVPDMNQDSMWYHLSVPQQWTFSGRFDAYPNVMQSAFPLAAEALYAIILIVGGDAVMCSLLSAVCGTGFFFALTGASWAGIGSERETQFTGWGVMAVVALVAPLMTMYGLIAPVQPKNDIITMFWAFTGAMALLLPMLAARKIPSTGWWLVGGFLLGTACSAKPPVLSMTFFVLVFAVAPAAWYERRERKGIPWKTLRGAGISLAMMGVAAMPWMTRGYLSHGVPLYPVGSSFFPLSPEFFPLDRSQTSIQGVPGLSVTDWWSKIREFPDRLVFGANHGEKFVFLYAFAGFSILFGGRGRWRWYGALLLVQMVFLVGITAGVEVYRLFSPAYALAAPAMAWLVAEYAPRVRPRVLYIAAIAIWIGVVWSVVSVQVRIANYTTMQWKFRPVLSEKDVLAYAAHAEKGGLYRDFPKVRSLIGKDERVLLLGATYPFYLHRDTLWNDETVGEGGVADRWHKMSPAEAVDFLREEEINVILYTEQPRYSKHPVPPVRGLIEAETVDSVAVPEELRDKGWAMYRVKVINQTDSIE